MRFEISLNENRRQCSPELVSSNVDVVAIESKPEMRLERAVAVPLAKVDVSSPQDPSNAQSEDAGSVLAPVLWENARLTVECLSDSDCRFMRLGIKLFKNPSSVLGDRSDERMSIWIRCIHGRRLRGGVIDCHRNAISRQEASRSRMRLTTAFGAA